jgi:hypothetical protein
MPTELEQRALPPLPQKEAFDPFGYTALQMHDYALRAIAAALQTQQPGAQAVGYVSPHVIEHLRNGGHSCTTITAHRAMLDDVALYTQPPSIPEPSKDDVHAACCAFPKSYPGLYEDTRAALTTYTARLRERIGGGA